MAYSRIVNKDKTKRLEMYKAMEKNVKKEIKDLKDKLKRAESTLKTVRKQIRAVK